MSVLTKGPSYPAGLAGAALLIWGGSLVAEPSAPTAWWVLRGSVALLAVLAAIMLVRRRNWSGLADPPFLMGAVVLVFYSLIPALAVAFAYGGPVAILPGDRSDVIRSFPLLADEAARRAVQSSAELSVLRFATLCLGVAACLAAGRWNRRPPVWPGQWKVALAIGCAVTLVNLSRRWDAAGPKAWLPDALAEQLLAVLPVMATACLAVLLLASVNRERHALIALAGYAAFCVLSFLPFGAKPVSWALVLCLLILFQAASGRWKVYMLAGVLFVPILFPVAIMKTREGAGQVITSVLVKTALWAKLVERQAETVYCLAFAEKQYRDQGASGGPGYFLAGLVPRALWPDKPDLSQGGRYAQDFCGWPANEAAATRHSASITLLGEPLVQAGAAGIAVAHAVILGLLAVGSAALLSGRPGLVVVALATLPWLMDFDQHFALWLANFVKFLLVAVLMAFVLGGRRTKRTLGRAADAAAR